MAAAIDWLDAYRAASLTIVSMYSKNATLECGCNGQTILAGHTAIAEYWYRRFAEMPAGELSSCDLMLMEFSSAIECNAALSMRF